MCWASKCCFLIKLDIGCVLIAFASLIFSAAMTVSSAVFLVYNFQEDKPLTHGSASAFYPPTTQFLTFKLSPSKLKILLSSAFGLGVLLMMASILLMIGIAKRKPGYLLFYFGFGIFCAIFNYLGGLLLLLDCYWKTSLVIFIAGALYIHFLVVVHTFYDALVKGKSDDSFDRLTENDFLSMDSDGEIANVSRD